MKSYKYNLSDEGYIIVFAKDAEEAYVKIQKWLPEIVVIPEQIIEVAD